MNQDLTAYLGYEECNRVRGLCGVVKQAGFPESNVLQSWGLSDVHVAEGIEITLSTIASGEKLLRDENKLRKDIHGKTEVGEMEAAGFVAACLRSHVDWLVIRGISDFGDTLKSDYFHKLASIRAVVTAADLVSHGLEIIPVR